jgi:hypothetical protein
LHHALGLKPFEASPPNVEVDGWRRHDGILWGASIESAAALRKRLEQDDRFNRRMFV